MNQVYQPCSPYSYTLLIKYRKSFFSIINDLSWYFIQTTKWLYGQCHNSDLTQFVLFLEKCKEEETGMSTSYVAHQIERSITGQYKEVTLAPFIHKAVIYIRTICPSLYFLIMRIRASQGRKKALKQAWRTCLLFSISAFPNFLCDTSMDLLYICLVLINEKNDKYYCIIVFYTCILLIVWTFMFFLLMTIWLFSVDRLF